MSRSRLLILTVVLAAISLAPLLRAESSSLRLLDTVGAKAGVVAVIDAPGGETESVLDLLEDNELRVYFQSDDPGQVAAMRRAGASAGVLGKRLFVDTGSPGVIQLARNLADAVLVADAVAPKVPEEELLRVLRPLGRAFVGGRTLVKPTPEGVDEWTHPYHGPDNNPQSRDRLARGDFRTQFIARPKFSPMPEQTVASGGRLFKAMGHIAHKQNQNAHLNTLLCINAYNGVILWKRPLPEGFMIHRNTMIATHDALYMGDHESCKVFDARTGKLLREITVDEELTDGPVWKWMAESEGTLYALVGNREVRVDTQRAVRRGLGHWPWGMWKGHDYADPKTSFGFGRTLVAIDLKSGKPRWHLRSEEFLDARGVTMNRSRIFACSPGKTLMAIDRDTGSIAWKQEGGRTIEAIGASGRAQHYVTGYATTCYAKCNDDLLFFAGPQRSRTVAVSAETGDVAWTYPDGNLQLVLRPDAVYAAGGQKSKGGVRLDYATGKVLATMPARRACTRATGSIDSIFFRARGGTVRVLTASNQEQHIAAMRPPCQDGVLISNGHLYWGPWMCGCQLSLYGNIGLGPADRTFASDAGTALALHGDNRVPEALDLKPGDWPSYRGNNDRSDFRDEGLPQGLKPDWSVKVSERLPTAPVTGGGLVFVGARSGAVRAFDASGKLRWERYTAGPVYYPPAVYGDRVFVGSADGRVYAFAARSGRSLWTFRVAPADRRIHVFGDLISRWPVAGGVVVEDNTVYAVAGIVNYDGTYVVALDAVTGELKRSNSRSGALAPKVNGGISLQGPLSVVGNELRFGGGGVYETACYDLESLACLNEPLEVIAAGSQTAFYPYYPEYGRFVSLQQACADGVLCFAASYEGHAFEDLTLQSSPGNKAQSGEAARVVLRRGGKLDRGKALWRDSQKRRFTAFMVSKDTLLATGHTADEPGNPFLVGIRIKDGADLFRIRTPADAVKAGLAIDHDNRVFVTLANGRLLSFVPAKVEPPPPPPVLQPIQEKPTVSFLAERSMKPYPAKTRHCRFPVQQTADPLGPFEGRGVYFQQRQHRDRELYYEIESRTPVHAIRYEGAATFQMMMEVLDHDGQTVLASAGPFNEGNNESRHIVKLPQSAGRRWVLRFHNRASTWFYIGKITLLERAP